MRGCLLVLVFTGICFSSCNREKAFKISITHYASAAGVTRKYEYDGSALTIRSYSDLGDHKPKPLYRQVLTNVERRHLAATIERLRLDTLKSTYKPPGYYTDGAVTILNIRKGFFHRNKTVVEFISVPAVDSLSHAIERIVRPKKFRAVVN